MCCLCRCWRRTRFHHQYYRYIFEHNFLSATCLLPTNTHKTGAIICCCSDGLYNPKKDFTSRSCDVIPVLSTTKRSIYTTNTSTVLGCVIRELLNERLFRNFVHAYAIFLKFQVSKENQGKTDHKQASMCSRKKNTHCASSNCKLSPQRNYEKVSDDWVTKNSTTTSFLFLFY